MSDQANSYESGPSDSLVFEISGIDLLSLQTEAEIRGMKVRDVVRHALGIGRLVLQEQANGNQVVFINPQTGEMREAVLNLPEPGSGLDVNLL